MLRPHWLDDVFDKVDDLESTFLDHPRVKAAFAMAAMRYHEQKKHYEENPKSVGASPAQAGLSTWLDVMDLLRDYDRPGFE